MKILISDQNLKANRQPLFVAFLVSYCFFVSLCMVKECVALQKPRTDEIEKLKKAGEYEKRVKAAKEIGNHKIDDELLKRAINKARRQALKTQGVTSSEISQVAPAYAPPPAWRGMPTKGNVKVFALLIDFPDYHASTPKDIVQSKLFGNGTSSQFPYESLAKYYDRSSYSQLDLSGGVSLGWYRPSYDRSTISKTSAGRESLIKEALDHFNAQGVDFTQFDNDNNGVIDYFLVIWSGPDTGWGSFWWGYQTSFGDWNYSLDGKKLGKYSWQWEGLPVGSEFNPTVAIHETGHALGLPDYYDYDWNIGPDGGVGGLDMMDGNWGDHNCFSKWVLDWIEPIVISSGSRNIGLNPSSTTRDAVLMMPNIALTDQYSEYFMMQNRDRGGNDLHFPNNGLLIWHIDATLNRFGSNFIFDNSYTDHKLLRLMEADSLEHIERDLPVDADDYYTANSLFNSFTIPSSRNYAGLLTDVSVGNITSLGSTFYSNVAIAPCSYSISTDTISAPHTAISGNISVAPSTAYCAWTASSNSPWITITSGGSGTGNGTVTFSVAANEGDRRTGTITVAGQSVTVTQDGLPPIANFTAFPTRAAAPFLVSFTDQSQRTVSWRWDFGDGTTSDEQSPTHTYANRGSYQVTLDATNASGTNTIIKTIRNFVDITPIIDLLLQD